MIEKRPLNSNKNYVSVRMLLFSQRYNANRGVQQSDKIRATVQPHGQTSMNKT